MNKSTTPVDALTRLSSYTDFVKIKKLAQAHETPFYALNLSNVKSNAVMFKNAIPNSEVFYAVKVNPDVEIIKELHSQGIGFDVASSGEVLLCKSLGISPDKMIFSNPVKKPSEIKKAFQEGINFFVFDNYFELDKLAANAPNSKVYLRLCVYGENSKINLNEKFVAMQDEAVDLMCEALKKGLNPVGLAFHVGMQCLSAESYVNAIEKCSQINDELKKQGIHIEFVNIGGGFPVKYPGDNFNLNDYFKKINEAIRTYFPETKVFLEPGSGMVGDSTSIVFSVIGKNFRGGKTWYYVDESIYSSFLNYALYGQNYSFYTLKKGELENCILAGRTCDSLDILNKDVKLPKLEIGDIVITRNAGAYTRTFNTNFNSFEAVKTVYFR
ncbi:Diaminopimelate decarboxylase [uncultured archaeon]|nr:Diaminopimelate decarboxylase [uncultured archaeon]